MIKLKDNIYHVGVQNPCLRVFDIIMKTEYGTTYNAYLVKGEKTALVETAHEKFFNEFLKNVEEIVPVSGIDYVILNHTEPDHTGSLVKILEKNPNITVIATAAGIKNAKAITNNAAFASRIVKNGDTLDLGGGMEMEFIVSPNLHWPDSMFTYLKNQNTLFSCDFLGAHYCEMAATDTSFAYPEKYDSAFLNYYQAIFGPFKPFVLAGLDKIAHLTLDMVCPSHGPVLQKGIRQAMEKYRAWSENHEPAREGAVFYVSAYGYTRKMAEHVAKTLTEGGLPTKAYDIICHDLGELKEILERASVLAFGSPTINRDAVKPVWDLLSVTDAVANKGKKCIVFGSYGWSGEACGQIADRVRGLKLNLVGEPFKVCFLPTDDDLNALADLSKQLL